MNVCQTASTAKVCKTSVMLNLSSVLEKDSFYKDGGKKCQQPPLIDCVYKDRMVLLHHIVPSAASVYKEGISTADLKSQLVLLGCGLDNSYARHFGVTYAVDLDSVIEQRARAEPSAEHGNIVNIVADLTDPSKLLNALQLHQVSRTIGTVVLLECVLAYVSSEDSDNLLRTVAQYFEDCIIVIYDPLYSLAGESMSSHSRVDQGDGCDYSVHLQKSFSKFKQKHEEKPSRKARMPLVEHGYGQAGLLVSSSVATSWSGAQRLSALELATARLQHAGWPHVWVASIQMALSIVGSPDDMGLPPSFLRVFDEFAALALLRDRYGIAVAGRRRQTFDALFDRLSTRKQELDQTGGEGSEARRLRSLEARLLVAEGRLNLIQRQQQIDRQQQTGTAISIRQMVVGDVDEVSAIYEQAFKDMGARYRAVQKFVQHSKKDLAKYWGAAQSSLCKQRQYWVAVAPSGSVVGCVGVKVSSAAGADDSASNPDSLAVAELTHMAVCDSSRRQGLATKLLMKALEYAASREVTRLDLSVLHDMLPARTLYERHGFLLQCSVPLSGSQLEGDSGACIVDHYSRAVAALPPR